jgi:simple sugar transport system ATP-binding protein
VEAKEMTTDRNYLIEMRGICKNFGAVQALRSVNLFLGYNEVLGLVGDNAAGKSTLMKVLSGAYIADRGDIFMDGQKVDISEPKDSRRLGIEMVYQDFALAGNIDVAGNIFLGREIKRESALSRLLRVMNRGKMEGEARSLLSRLRIQVASVRHKVDTLSGGQRQAVAIARATAFNARAIIMDEPTANLSVAAIEKVREQIKGLKEHNVSVILISHRLEDIFQVGDRIMVLKHGKRVGDRPISDITRDEVVSLMVGAQDDFPDEETPEALRSTRPGY